jgi:hypothetical protein
MYVHPIDENNVVSYIHGYENGTELKCDFTQLIRQHLTDLLGIPYLSDGWPGQIKRFANKKYIPWLVAFKQIGFAVLLDFEKNEGLDSEVQEMIKRRIIGLIEGINEKGDPWFGRTWSEDWESVCLTKNKWFQEIWSKKEFQVIKAIHTEVNNGRVVEDWKQNYKPRAKLVELRDRFQKSGE